MYSLGSEYGDVGQKNTPPELQKRISWDDLDKRKFYVIGPSVFVFVRAAVYPSQLVKTRLQIQSSKNPLYRGTFDAFRKIMRQEGFLGLYKGFGASLLNIFIGNIYISIYELNHKFAMAHMTIDPAVANFIAGSTASIVNQTVIVPLDIVSQRMMIDGQGGDPTRTHRTQSMLTISKDIYRQHGIRGFYKGYLPSVATYAPSSGLWWFTYGFSWPKYYVLIPFEEMEPLHKQILAQALGGGTAGCLTAVVTNPMDVIRTRAQIYTHDGPMNTFRHLIQEQGYRGLMSGVVARVMSMGPSGVLVTSAYELVKRLSRKD